MAANAAFSSSLVRRHRKNLRVMWDIDESRGNELARWRDLLSSWSIRPWLEVSMAASTTTFFILLLSTGLIEVKLVFVLMIVATHCLFLTFQAALKTFARYIIPSST
ncbi:hypothetical protein F4779DRAFT_581927 [Xylariaceae sp. FL0662B]|nr:hypothetical protein F4779DRAFT_581927 [Xylariaceae sp. FL0662B]